jgi:hypothetical protein
VEYAKSISGVADSFRSFVNIGCSLSRREPVVTIDALPRSCRGVYGIAVTSELTGIGPQTLRLYERRGLLTPARTSGGTRRYSDDDLVRLARIAQLMEDGVNVPGIQRILALESENADLASRLEGSESGASGK